MISKLGFIAGTIIAEVLTYFLITAYWSSLMVPAVATAENATDPAKYPFAHAAIGAAPIWLYVLPAVIGVGAVVWKLRQREQ